MDISFGSALVVLLLVVDPFGNVPLFAAVMSHVDRSRRPRVILRECAIAYGTLVLFVFTGQGILELFGLSGASLSIAGGVILFLIALRMIFKSESGVFGRMPEGEPFIVPLAIPSIAGPTAMATVLLLVSRAPERRLEWIIALTVAVGVTALILLFSEAITRRVGERALAALERLTGLILTAVAVQMLLRGIEEFVGQLR